MARSYPFGAASRLRLNADFLEIRRDGKPYRCPYFAVFSRIRADSDADFSRPRIGISTSRRVGNAVVRNKARRRLREIFRLMQSEIEPRADIVLSVRAPASRASYEELEARFRHALKFKRLLAPPATEPAGQDKLA